VASATFLVSAILGGQWFIAAGLAMVAGACVGFLVFNFPRFGTKPGRIFMGDGGSLVLGFTLAFLTTRATFYDPDVGSSAWFAAIMPVIVLAVPLYDLLSVTAVRLSQGRSPFVGDLQHLSHRLVRRGLTRRDAVLLIWILTAITSIGGISLRSLEPWQAVLVGGQTLLTLAGLAVFERSSREKS
jgi:UDP-GlcNAc:undecaprenyl-phosphate GlcNAc-1-phosphate transferase